MSQKVHVMHGRDHVPEGADPIPGLLYAPGYDTLDQVIAGLDPSGWWKLNESSGLTAADSSGNGLDMTDTWTNPPLWGAPAGPPGTQAADFENGDAAVDRSWPALTGSFTAGIWVSRNSGTGCQIMGQGNPGRASGVGWMLANFGSGHVPANTPYLTLAGLGSIVAANPLAADTWALLAAVKDGTTWRLYVNGLLEPGSLTGTYTPSSNPSPLWIGHDGLGGVSLEPATFTGSYAFLIPSALTSAELLNIYDTGTLTPSSDLGKVPVANGLGGSSWEFPIEVTY